MASIHNRKVQLLQDQEPLCVGVCKRRNGLFSVGEYTFLPSHIQRVEHVKLLREGKMRSCWQVSVSEVIIG